MKRSIFILPILSLLTWSCEKEIKLNESDIESRITVNCLFEENDTMRLILSESRNILYNNGGALPNILTGKAELFDASGQSVGKFVHEGFGSYYLPNFKPSAPDAYELKVENTGFESVSSKSAIPTAVSIDNIDTVRVADYMNISVSFTDNQLFDNFYSLELIAKQSFTYEIGPGVTQTDYYDNNWVCTKDLNAFGSLDLEGDICAAGPLLIKDDDFNGSQYSFQVKKYMDDNPDTIIVKLRSISADLYKYGTTLQTYKDVQGNPFGEPVQVFSNIVNGFGIFAGQSVYTDTIFVK